MAKSGEKLQKVGKIEKMYRKVVKLWKSGKKL